jgi:protein-S-isoprenylcysteine O-methyltransferase Ste14
MTSVILILLAVLLYGVVHSWLASLGVKAWAWREFDHLAERWYRLAYNVFAALTLLPLLALPILLSDQRLYTIPFPGTLLFVGLQILGALIIVVGLLQTGVWSFFGLRQLVNPIPAKEKTELVTRGLYRRMRHPLYTGGLLFIWFTPLMTRNLLALNIGLTLYLIVGAFLEERRLLHEFGEVYAEYQRCVPMIIPLPWKHC